LLRKSLGISGIFSRDSEILKIDIKMLLVLSKAGVGKLLKMKGKTVAYLVGPAAKTRASGRRRSSYAASGEGDRSGPGRFERKHNRRKSTWDHPVEIGTERLGDETRLI
jgi:hypothetical protein